MKSELFSFVMFAFLLVSSRLDLLQISPLINKQTGGKKKKREEKREGERDLWTTRSENEAPHTPAQV